MTNPLKFWAVTITLACVLFAIMLARLDERTVKTGRPTPKDQDGEATKPIKLKKLPDFPPDIVDNYKEVTPTPSPLPVERSVIEQLGDGTYDDIRIGDKIRGYWLLISSKGRHSGYDPCFTSVESFYRPVVKQLPDKRWEIVFETQDLTTEF